MGKLSVYDLIVLSHTLIFDFKIIFNATLVCSNTERYTGRILQHMAKPGGPKCISPNVKSDITIGKIKSMQSS